jgi:cytochrome c553
MKRYWFWGLVVPYALRRLAPAWFLESPIAVAARHPWITLAALAVLLATGVLAVSASGIMSIKASAGHWAITEWFLQFSKTRSIATHALGIDAPPLDNPLLVLRGAGYYDLGCRPCHGGAGGNVPRVGEYMLPPPPDLTVRVQTRRDAELFYVVRHGIKLTGMPAWPTVNREDEVWAMVAFLRRLPRLGDEEYQRLTRGEDARPFALTPPAAPPEVVTEICARCHGADGDGRGAFPRLAGQRAEYLDRALRAYAAGRRHSGVMGPVASALTADARSAAAAYYAALPATTPGQPTDDARITRGQRLATMGDPSRSVPACVECHAPAAAKNPAYPILAGQYADYLALQLSLLQRRARGGSEYVHLMHSFVDRLTAGQIQDVAAYFANTEASADAREDGPDAGPAGGAKP